MILSFQQPTDTMKNLKIEDRTHAKLKRAAKADGRLISSLGDKLLSDALNQPAKKAAKKAKP